MFCGWEVQETRRENISGQAGVQAGVQLAVRPAGRAANQQSQMQHHAALERKADLVCTFGGVPLVSGFQTLM